MKIRVPRKLKKWVKSNCKFSSKDKRFIRIAWLGLRGRSGVYKIFFYDKKNNEFDSNFLKNK